MKTILCLLAMVSSLHADPFRFAWRSSSTVDLRPLFQWWTYVSKATNRPIDMTVMDSNKLASIINLWGHLPAKPLPQWCRIKADKITVDGSYWLLEAEIQSAPMMVRREKIYLANPPVIEVQTYNWVQAELPIAERAMDTARTISEGIQQDQASNQTDLHNLSMMQAAMPWNGAVNPQINSIGNDQSQLSGNLSNMQSKMAGLSGKIDGLLIFSRMFPGPNYSVDHFAVRTGKFIGGIEVYDLGLANGLNYSQ